MQAHIRVSIRFLGFLFLCGQATQAGQLEFRDVLYRAMDAIVCSRQVDFNNVCAQAPEASWTQAITELMRAQEQAPGRETKKAVQEAVRILKSQPWTAKIYPTDERVSTAILQIENALHLTHVNLNPANPTEQKWIERLILVQMFGADFEKVKIGYENIESGVAAELLLTYFADPGHAGRFDPDVRALISGNGSQVTFTAPEIKFGTSSAEEASEFMSLLQLMIKTLGPDSPTSLKMKLNGTDILLAIEIRGFSAIPLLESSLLLASQANGNRYIFSLAKAFEHLSKVAFASDFSGLPGATEAARKASRPLWAIARFLRSSLISTRYYQPTVESVKAVLSRAVEHEIQNMTANLTEEVERMRTLGRSAKEIAEQEARTARWISGARATLNTGLAKIDSAVRLAEGAPGFNQLPDPVKTKQLAEAAKNAVDMKVFNLSLKPFKMSLEPGIMNSKVMLQAVAYTLVAYDLYMMSMSMARNSESCSKAAYWRAQGGCFEALQNYGTRLAHTMMYSVPVLGQAAAAWDILVLGLKVGTQVEIASSLELLEKIPRGAQDAGLRWSGVDRLDVIYFAPTELPPVLAKAPDGVWVDHEFNIFRRELKGSQIEDLANGKLSKLVKDLNQHLKRSALLHLHQIYAVDNAIDSVAMWQQWAAQEIQTARQLFDPEKGYFPSTARVLDSLNVMK